MEESSIETSVLGSENKNQATPVRSLADLEHIVEKGLSTYQAAGGALDEIQSRKLYKPQYPNFRTYLKERWGISRAHGYRLIAAAKIAKTSPIGDKPKNENQARKRAAKSVTGASESKIVHNLDLEFDRFKATVQRWENALTREDFTQLIERVRQHVASLEMEVAA